MLRGMWGRLAVVGFASAQELPYTEGPVTVVTAVKIMDGQFDNYMKYLQTTYKPVMEAQTKEGIVLEVVEATPRRVRSVRVHPAPPESASAGA